MPPKDPFGQGAGEWKWRYFGHKNSISYLQTFFQRNEMALKRSHSQLHCIRIIAVERFGASSIRVRRSLLSLLPSIKILITEALLQSER